MSSNTPTHGQGNCNHHGDKQAHTHCEPAHNAAFATYVHYDGSEPTIDLHALTYTPSSANYSPPTFNNTIKAFNLVHHLGIKPFCETICTLNHIMLTVSASHDQPKAGPLSLGKHPCPKECLTPVKKDTISLGDDNDNPFSNMYKINGIVLNWYNVVLMDLDMEAALFRQVLFSCMLIETDMLSLHVHNMPTLWLEWCMLHGL